MVFMFPTVYRHQATGNHRFQCFDSGERAVCFRKRRSAVPVCVVQTNIDAASTVDAFLKDAKDREAALASDLENTDYRIGEERPASSVSRPLLPSSARVSSAVSSAKPRTVLPMTESPGRTSLPASEARAKLLGHAKFIPFDTSAASKRGASGWQ
jgi:hypothetical protein